MIETFANVRATVALPPFDHIPKVEEGARLLEQVVGLVPHDAVRVREHTRRRRVRPRQRGDLGCIAPHGPPPHPPMRVKRWQSIGIRQNVVDNRGGARGGNMPDAVNSRGTNIDGQGEDAAGCCLFHWFISYIAATRPECRLFCFAGKLK
jgi:hypothetical protein